MALLRPARLTRRRKSAELRRQGPPDDRHRHPSAHHCRRRGALSAGAARRPSIRLVAHAAGDGREDDRRHGRGRRAEGRRWCRLRPATATTIPTSPTRSPRTPTASPACSRSTCSRPTRRNACATGDDRKLTGLRLFTFGSTMAEPGRLARRPEILSGLGAAPANWACRSACRCRPRRFPQRAAWRERFPNVRIVLDHLARPVLDDGPPYAAAASLFALARLPEHLSQADAAHLRRGAQRQGDAGDLLCQARRRIRRVAAGLGLELSVERRPAARAAATARESLASLPQADRDWIFAKTAQSLYPALKD